MIVSDLFSNPKDVTIKNYLEKFGINDVKEYLNPNLENMHEPYQHYNNIDKAIELYANNNKKIIIVVDCDCDGFTSASEIYNYTKRLNKDANIEFLIHETKMHGLTDMKIYNYLLSIENPTLLIIPDASGEEWQFKELSEHGFEILVLDHHNQANKTSNYAIIVNNQYSPLVQNKQASGSMVTYQFLRALDDYYNNDWAKDYIDLAMLGMIGDDMDLCQEYNRKCYVLGSNFVQNPFLKCLVDKFIKDEITPHNLAFSIVPKINATIRSDDYELKKEMFLAFIGEVDADKIANKCRRKHEEQKKNVKEVSEIIYELADINKKVMISDYENMLPSYSGLIAGRLAGDLNKPSVVVKFNEEANAYIGSIRSPIPMKDKFNKFESVDWCNGHSCAAGIKINNLDLFRQECEQLELTNDIIHIVTASFDNVNKIPMNLFTEFENTEQLWGSGLPKPSFHISGIRINGKDIQQLGRGNTIKFKCGNVDFIKFFTSNKEKEEMFLGENKELKVEVIGELCINEWNENSYPQVIIDKFEFKEVGKLDWGDLF